MRYAGIVKFNSRRLDRPRTVTAAVRLAAYVARRAARRDGLTAFGPALTVQLGRDYFDLDRLVLRVELEAS